MEKGREEWQRHLEKGQGKRVINKVNGNSVMRKGKGKGSLTLFDSVARRRRRKKGYKASRATAVGRAEYASGGRTALNAFGRGFTESFPKILLKGKKGRKFSLRCATARWESCWAAVLETVPVRGAGTSTRVADVNLGFEREAVIVEAMHGHEKMQPWIERFREMHEKPVFNFVLERVEEHARLLGFKQVKIRVPESLWFFKSPSLFGNKMAKLARITDLKEREKQGEKAKEDIRRGMEALYKAVAKAMGYKRKGLFYVKRL